MNSYIFKKKIMKFFYNIISIYNFSKIFDIFFLKNKGINFKILLELFLKEEYNDNFHMFGNVLANVSANELVRAFMNKEEFNFLQRILP